MRGLAALVALAWTALAAQTAASADSGIFANRAFDVFFTEIQITDDPTRPEIPQKRHTRVDIGENSVATVVTRNWDRPPPNFERLTASGPLGDWSPMSNRARVLHEIDGKRLIQTIVSRGFVNRLVIDLDGRECRARVDYALMPGEPAFRMRNIALGTPMLVRGFRVEGASTCGAMYAPAS